MQRASVALLSNPNALLSSMHAEVSQVVKDMLILEMHQRAPSHGTPLPPAEPQRHHKELYPAPPKSIEWLLSLIHI
eukprot:5295150-Amphidinium_carterae.1